MRTHALLPLLFALALTTGACGSDAESDYVDSMAAEHAGDRPEATPMSDAEGAAVVADTVRYGTVDGEPLTGYLAVPARPDSALQAHGRPAGGALPAVIVIHEWWGLNDNIRSMARRLAQAGYAALAVDMYGGQVAESPDEARQLMQEALADAEAPEANLTAAYRFLTDEYGAPAVGSVGWCFGGSMSLRAATALPERLDAAVIYYGHVEAADRESLAALKMPILGLFGAEDQGIPVEGVRQFESTLQELGKEAQIVVYEGAGHAFANPSGQNYVAEAARDAWARTTAFFETHLYEGE